MLCVVFFFKQKTAYEMRISDWSSDVCSSDLQIEHQGRIDQVGARQIGVQQNRASARQHHQKQHRQFQEAGKQRAPATMIFILGRQYPLHHELVGAPEVEPDQRCRSEEHTSELQSLMRISYAVYCLKKKKTKT